MPAVHGYRETEPALDELASDVRDAQEAIRSVLRAEPERCWAARDVQDAVVGSWTKTIISLAFWDLVRRGELVAGDDLQFRSGAS